MGWAMPISALKRSWMRWVWAIVSDSDTPTNCPADSGHGLPLPGPFFFEPEILLLDEPTSALDVSIQAEILNLLKQVQRKRTLTYFLVSHNLAVVSHMCNTIAVMKQGAVRPYLTKSS